MDIYNPGGWRPAVSRNVLAAGFRYDLPVILADLGAGDIRERYPEAPCWLVFRQQGNELEVSAINDFGRDLLELCDGSLTPEQIADRLRHSYGATADPAEFDERCRKALRQLADLRLVAADDIHESSEGR
jgi:hypothetical protein